MKIPHDLKKRGSLNLQLMLSRGELPDEAKPFANAALLADDLDMIQQEVGDSYDPDGFALARTHLADLFDALTKYAKDRSLLAAEKHYRDETWRKVSFQKE